MTEHAVRVRVADDLERYAATDSLVWFAEPTSAPTEELVLGLPEDQRFAAEVEDGDPSTYAGVYGVYPLTLQVPGGHDALRPVPAAGLTWVGVHPDNRRRGVLTAMLRHHFEQVHGHPDTHVSVLHASEPAIYGRYGYGLASLECEVTLGRGTTLDAPHLEEPAGRTTTSLCRVEDPKVPERLRECHLGTAELGAVVGEPGYYHRVCSTLPEEQRGKEPLRVLFARRDGVDVGFALFRRSHKWERSRPAGEITVWAVVGDPPARLALLRRLVDFDLIGSVKVGTVGADDPLLRWVGGPRGASDVATHDNLWVRLVDLPAALADRSWSAPCDVVAEVADRDAPWNDGRWRIRADGSGRAVVQPTTDDPDLALPVAALGAAYLGGQSLVAMLRAGQLAEHRPGAVGELWRALRTEVTPTAAVMF